MSHPSALHGGNKLLCAAPDLSLFCPRSKTQPLHSETPRIHEEQRLHGQNNLSNKGEQQKTRKEKGTIKKKSKPTRKPHNPNLLSCLYKSRLQKLNLRRLAAAIQSFQHNECASSPCWRHLCVVGGSRHSSLVRRWAQVRLDYTNGCKTDVLKFVDGAVLFVLFIRILVPSFLFPCFLFLRTALELEYV